MVTGLLFIYTYLCGLGSVVSIATGYRLDGLGIESRWGARFSAPVQTGPGAHPASCTVGTGAFPGVKSSWGVMLIPHHLLVPWSRKSRTVPLWAVWPVQSLSACTRVHFSFILTLIEKPTGIFFLSPLKMILFLLFFLKSRLLNRNLIGISLLEIRC